MAGSVRPWAAHPEAVDDRDRYAEMTTAERLECFAEVCELARTIPKDLADIGRPLQIQRGRIDPTFVRQSLVHRRRHRINTTPRRPMWHETAANGGEADGEAAARA